MKQLSRFIVSEITPATAWSIFWNCSSEQSLWAFSAFRMRIEQIDDRNMPKRGNCMM